MEVGHPSKTALQTAMRRAAHQIFDRPRVFDDPLALRIIGHEHEQRLRLNPAATQMPLSLRLRAHVVARAQFAETALSKAAERGLQQLVILGAGLDTTAYRSLIVAKMHIVEVDEPATQAWKRFMLRRAGIQVPSNLSFLAINFERQSIVEALADAGLDLGLPVFFSCLGVVPFLTPGAVIALLRSVGQLSAGTEMVFDYIDRPEKLADEQRRVFETAAGRVATIGEPWRSFFDPEAIATAVRKFGFNEIENLDTNEINSRYFVDRCDGLMTGGLVRLMRAKV
jgi:methyltransferase (TIGR00027 family)